MCYGERLQFNIVWCEKTSIPEVYDKPAFNLLHVNGEKVRNSNILYFNTKAIYLCQKRVLACDKQNWLHKTFCFCFTSATAYSLKRDEEQYSKHHVAFRWHVIEIVNREMSGFRTWKECGLFYGKQRAVSSLMHLSSLVSTVKTCQTATQQILYRKSLMTYLCLL